MSTVIDQNIRIPAAQPMSSMSASTAANDDHLPRSGGAHDASEPAGWNAHDVWRRLIKEARDRREATGRLPQ
jgi:hypothetical protein